ncbi:hypothetical protein S245_040289 [Arachis hypogaea]
MRKKQKRTLVAATLSSPRTATNAHRNHRHLHSQAPPPRFIISHRSLSVVVGVVWSSEPGLYIRRCRRCGVIYCRPRRRVLYCPHRHRRALSSPRRHCRAICLH